MIARRENVPGTSKKTGVNSLPRRRGTRISDNDRKKRTQTLKKKQKSHRSRGVHESPHSVKDLLGRKRDEGGAGEKKDSHKRENFPLWGIGDRIEC